VRTFVKWTGAAVTVLLLIVWVGSGWWEGGVEIRSVGGAGFSGGRVILGAWPPSRWEFEAIEWTCVRGPWVGYGWWFHYLPPPVVGIAMVFIPIWSLALLTGVPTAWMFRTDRKRRRGEREGLCAKCGYDLRGLPDGRACPECGAVR
jgi:hypothetical protein